MLSEQEFLALQSEIPFDDQQTAIDAALSQARQDDIETTVRLSYE